MILEMAIGCGAAVVVAAMRFADRIDAREKQALKEAEERAAAERCRQNEREQLKDPAFRRGALERKDLIEVNAKIEQEVNDRNIVVATAKWNSNRAIQSRVEGDIKKAVDELGAIPEVE